ncbi:50S ribosomal protein L3 [archaeon]|jgi:large subunit ribosomal protein L3|nr:50S ribosomal protein L3 [archaeon]MBT3578247.1 50S ribosomal protein L3 [archaeon]MBT6819832.1 50S ribosomal protein L3 [archaeon]MBT6956592.1 50S ribosomal protein L3 [archaeon]MBT7025614.1 50S ribosomal protein L3 [archaeon]
MTDNNGIHSGSLQFYPRVRAKKIMPSVNWKPLSKEGVGLMGFIGYKVGMVSAHVADSTEHSMTKDKKIVVPATIVECPVLKIYSVRFYKNNKVLKDVVVSNDKVLKRNVKLSKTEKTLGDEADFDDVRVLVYSDVGSTGIGKKKPDMIEMGLSGSNEEKINFIKEKIGKDISVSEVFGEGLVDVRAVTKGFGTQGPVKRFGIALKDHKSEKGRRRPGSLAPWHPSRVTFRAPQAGQTGFHNRIAYNNLILQIGKISEKDINGNGGFHKYGNVKTEYMILKGSIPGPKKRGLVITQAMRPSKFQKKKKLEVLDLR